MKGNKLALLASLVVLALNAAAQEPGQHRTAATTTISG